MQALFLYFVPSCLAVEMNIKKTKIKKSNKRRAFGFIGERWCNYNTMKGRLIVVERAQVDAKAQRIPQGRSVACCSWVKSGWVNVKKLRYKRKQWLWDIFTTFFLFQSPHLSSYRRNKAAWIQKSDKKQTRFREWTSRPSGHRRSRRIYGGSATPGWWTQSKFM